MILKMYMARMKIVTHDTPHYVTICAQSEKSPPRIVDAAERKDKMWNIQQF